jgi:hypothetical protein
VTVVRAYLADSHCASGYPGLASCCIHRQVLQGNLARIIYGRLAGLPAIGLSQAAPFTPV